MNIAFILKIISLNKIREIDFLKINVKTIKCFVDLN